MQRERGRRHRTLVRCGAVVSAVTMLGLLLTPVAAQAATTRSANATGWGTSQGAADSNARAEARYRLNSFAASLGEVCSGLTYTSSLVYTVPSGGGYVYSATATGDCAPV